MNAGISRKRLGEAKDVLTIMERACRSIVHKEQFESVFTTFLSMARSVMHVMASEDESKFKRLFPYHEFGLTGADKTLFIHMRECRNETLKEGTLKSLRNSPDEIAVHNEYRDESGRHFVTAPVGFSDGPPLTLKKPRYYMTIDGQDRDAIELCRRYVEIIVELLRRLNKAELPQRIGIDLDDG